VEVGLGRGWFAEQHRGKRFRTGGFELRIALFNPQSVTRNAKSGPSDFLRSFAREFLAGRVERIVRSQSWAATGV